jgi:SOS-response transcriptional repressor LexA
LETLLCHVPQRSTGVLLPLYKYIPAGDPESAFEIFMHGKCDLNGLLMGSRNALVFYVQGILTDEFDLCYGDLVIVHKGVDVQKGDIIFILCCWKI